MVYIYPSRKFECARCGKRDRDMALITVNLPDNRPFEYLNENRQTVKTLLIKMIVCYDHLEEVYYYLMGRGRQLKRLYPKDIKQKSLYEVHTFD
jgi:hypothetical protein